MDQVTAVFEVLVTVAVNCCVWEAASAAVPGLRATATGVSVTVLEADFVVSAWLVAVTVTVCCVVMLEGAV
jgi:hypothetical protein